MGSTYNIYNIYIISLISIPLLIFIKTFLPVMWFDLKPTNNCCQNQISEVIILLNLKSYHLLKIHTFSLNFMRLSENSLQSVHTSQCQMLLSGAVACCPVHCFLKSSKLDRTAHRNISEMCVLEFLGARYLWTYHKHQPRPASEYHLISNCCFMYFWNF